MKFLISRCKVHCAWDKRNTCPAPVMAVHILYKTRHDKNLRQTFVRTVRPTNYIIYTAERSECFTATPVLTTLNRDMRFIEL